MNPEALRLMPVALAIAKTLFFWASIVLVIYNTFVLSLSSLIGLSNAELPLDRTVGGLALLLVLVAFLAFRIPAIERALRRVLLPQRVAPPLSSRRFRGIARYSREDEDRLPGRRAVVQDCWMRVQDRPFVVIDGEPGCGKSSLMGAGLVPRAGADWNVAYCRIEGAGLASLGVLVKGFDRDPTALQGAKIRDWAFEHAETRVNHQAPVTALLCLDQFEQLLLQPDVTVARGVLIALKGGLASGLFRVVIGIRSDYVPALEAWFSTTDASRETLRIERDGCYTLQAFRAREALAVTQAIMGLEDDLDHQHDNERLAAALVHDLLAPPRDPRFSREDAKTVLPIELQMVGERLEVSGRCELSLDHYRDRGGAHGLLRDWITDAAREAAAAIGVNHEAIVLLLQRLASSTTSQEMPVDAIRGQLSESHALQSLAMLESRAVVRKGSLVTAGVQRFALTHDRLVQVLAESPQPQLRRASAAAARLSFWREREKARRHKAHPAWPARTIPAAEVISLWRFALTPVDRSLLRSEIRALITRAATVGVVLAFPALAWLGWTRTDRYQLVSLLRDAPIAGALADGYMGDSAVASWVATLIETGRGNEGIRTLRSIDEAKQCGIGASAAGYIAADGASSDPIEAEFRNLSDDAKPVAVRSCALIALADASVQRGAIEEALALAARIPEVELRSVPLSHIAGALGRAGSIDRAIAVAAQIPNRGVPLDSRTLVEESRNRVLFNIASSLIASGRTPKAFEAIRQLESPGDRAVSFSLAASGLSERGESAAALIALREAAAIAEGVTDPYDRLVKLGALAYTSNRLGDDLMADRLWTLAADLAERLKEPHQRVALAPRSYEWTPIGQTQLRAGPSVRHLAQRLINLSRGTSESSRVEMVRAAVRLTAVSSLGEAATLAPLHLKGPALALLQSELAREYARRGNAARASALWDDALVSAEEFGHSPDARVDALRTMVYGLTESGRSAQAINVSRRIVVGYMPTAPFEPLIGATTAEDIISTINASVAPDLRPPVLTSLIQGAIRAGKVGPARDLISMVDESLRPTLLVDLVKHLVEKQRLAEALEQAATITAPGPRSSSYAATLVALSKENRTHDAQRAGQLAIEAASRVLAPEARVKALNTVAIALQQSNANAEAARVALRVVIDARDVFVPREHDDALLSAAGTLAAAGRLRAARLACSDCSGSGRLRAYDAILRAEAIRHDPTRRFKQRYWGG